MVTRTQCKDCAKAAKLVNPFSKLMSSILSIKTTQERLPLYSSVYNQVSPQRQQMTKAEKDPKKELYRLMSNSSR